ncbi:ParB/RepB/Spo0J family partition protein [Desulfopila sp. IMCC35006]|uniref:ParB/RepB/Spo0J family partition protein n=1 Tax=Desulfopila sp. IMCC35006 TaxID=2569542 RepID=UPI0010AD2658|nr:ParB/RepB/Spo0J family partition protein [Desulfopila sp. IMCC35006]TKB26293.1 ParB/RepB/Spo0J family partition protein [Desulfopila sp. IMCC35006]
MSKKTGLGQGVGLLFGEEQEKFFECNINKIIPNKYQPRTHFNADDLQELADSIREKGVIQPLIVTSGPNDDFELIAGERRLRASKLAGLTHVPVIVLDVDQEDSLLELALIENVQRTDLNPIEEAEAYKKLIEKFGYTQEETAKRVGKQRSTVTNMLRLLKLPEIIRRDITDGLLSEGHGRALVKLADEPLKIQEIRNVIIKNGLSVRQTEKIIKKATLTHSRPKRPIQPPAEEIPLSYKNSLVTQLTNRLNSKVAITQNGTRGKIEIEYYSLDDLDRVADLLLGE